MRSEGLGEPPVLSSQSRHSLHFQITTCNCETANLVPLRATQSENVASERMAHRSQSLHSLNPSFATSRSPLIPHPRINPLIDHLGCHIAEDHDDSGQQADHHQQIVVLITRTLIG